MSRSIFIYFIIFGIGSNTYLGSILSERALNEWILTVDVINKRVDRYETKAKRKILNLQTAEDIQLDHNDQDEGTTSYIPVHEEASSSPQSIASLQSVIRISKPVRNSLFSSSMPSFWRGTYTSSFVSPRNNSAQNVSESESEDDIFSDFEDEESSLISRRSTRVFSNRSSTAYN